LSLEYRKESSFFYTVIFSDTFNFQFLKSKLQFSKLPKREKFYCNDGLVNFSANLFLYVNNTRDNTITFPCTAVPSGISAILKDATS
jgi:hypothetical protein